MSPVQAQREVWNDERMDEFASRTEANFGEVREAFGTVRDEIKQQGTELRREINDQRVELRHEIKEQGVELRREIRAARDHTDTGLAGLRAEMNERFAVVESRFAGLDRRFDILTGALITGFIGLIVIHFVG
jgi:hypothetical protein